MWFQEELAAEGLAVTSTCLPVICMGGSTPMREYVYSVRNGLVV